MYEEKGSHSHNFSCLCQSINGELTEKLLAGRSAASLSVVSLCLSNIAPVLEVLRDRDNSYVVKTGLDLFN